MDVDKLNGPDMATSACNGYVRVISGDLNAAEWDNCENRYNSVDSCVGAITQMQEKLLDEHLPCTLRGIQQCIAETAEETQQIHSLDKHMHDSQKKGKSEDEVKRMHTLHKVLKEMSKEKCKCLDTLLNIAEVEEYYQTLAAEVDTRAIQLSSIECPTTQDAQDFEALGELTRNYHDCIYSVRSTWSWLIQASRCMEIHLTNAAQYHQFFHEVKHYDHGMKLLLAKVLENIKKLEPGNQDVVQLVKEMKDTIRQLLEYQVRIDVNFEQATEIVPLHLRKQPVVTPLRIKSLVTYQQKDIGVVEGEKCLLLDNSELTKWRIRTSAGVEGYMPAIIFLIPPPDKQVVLNAQRSRQQLLATWLDCFLLVKQQAVTYLQHYLTNSNISQLKCLKPGQRSEVVESLDQTLKLLCTPLPGQQQQQLESFKAGVEEWRNQAASMEGTQRAVGGLATSLQVEWAGNRKLIRQVEEFQAYVRAYKEELDNSCQTRNFLIRDEDGHGQYKSSAYIERLKPVELDHSQEGVEFPRHMTIAERKPLSFAGFGSGAGGGGVGAYDPELAEEIAKTTMASQLLEEASEETTIDDEYSSQTIRETQTFTIKGVINPKDNEEISIYEAINKGIISQTQGLYRDPQTGSSMPIPEAMNKGLILVEFSKKKVEAGELIRRGIIHTTTSLEKITYMVKSVYDPTTGEKVSVSEAIARGIIDEETGKYINLKTGDKYNLSDAIDKGLLEVEITQRKPRDDLPDYSQQGNYVEEAYIVNGVLDPRVGREISLEKACRSDIIDRERGLYIYPITNKELELGIAIQRGLLKARLADPEEDANHPNLLIARIWRGPRPKEVKDYNKITFGKLKSRLPLTKGGIRDQTTGKRMTVEEAVESGILQFNPLHIMNNNGDKYCMHEAAVLGLVEPHTAREIFRALEPNSLGRYIERKEIDPRTGSYYDADKRRTLTLAAAIEEGKLDADNVYYMETSSRNILSLGAAIEEKKWDAETGKLVDPVSGREMTLADAIANRVIEPNVYADKLANQICALKCLNDHMDTKSTWVKSPVNGSELSVEDSILEGVIDLPSVDYVNVNSSTHQGTFIPHAVESELLAPKVGKDILGAVSKMSLGNVLALEHIDPNTGKFIHPDTKRQMSIKEAIDNGFIEPSVVFFEDPANDRITSLYTHTEEGKFNPSFGKFKDPFTGLEVSIANAIKKKVINPHIDPEKFLSGKKPIQDLIKSGKIDPNTAIFVAPDGTKMTLKEALANGLLSPESVVKVDPKTGHVVLVDEASRAMVEALLDTRARLDWVGGIEETLAVYGRPGEDTQEISQQISTHKVLKQEVTAEKPSIDGSIQRAQALLEGNNNAPKDKGVQQQNQRLRVNTSDLKVRCDGVENELSDRLTTLQVTQSDLDLFSAHATDFSQWSEQAQREITKVRASAADIDKIDRIKDKFESFNENVMAKEDDLESLNKSAAKVKDSLKSYDKDLGAFRQAVQSEIEPPSDSLAPSQINHRLQDANQGYRTLVNESSDLMAQLGDTAEKVHRYNGLKGDLSQSLPAVEGQVQQACGAEIDPESDLDLEFENLKSLTGHVIAEGKKVEDLRSVGEELLGILEALECGETPKAREIRKAIDDAAQRYDGIQGTVVDKQHSLNRILAENQDAAHLLDSLFAWVEETEDLFSNLRPVSADKHNLNQQIQAHKVISSDIENHKQQVDSVLEKCQYQPGSQEDMDGLLDRYDNLISSSQQRGAELDQVVQKLNTLHNNVNALESWLAHAVHSMKRESTDFDPNSLRTRIENLYTHKQGKQKDLDNIKAIGKELMQDPATGDKNKLRETLVDVQSKWHDLTELLVQMISFAALREIDDLLKYLDKAENEINTAEPLSTDPETLAVQLRDHKLFHEDLENKRQAVNETIDKCNKMLRETTNEEAGDIKNKLDTIRNQADLVCKLSNERLGLLEEALPLASHFSETHADLQSWLGEIEAEINSIDVPTGGDTSSEQIRKQQDNAKTTQRIIEDHKPLVEDLKITGQEIMEICGEEDIVDVKDDVDIIQSKYDEVRAILREKLNRLDEAFRSITSDVGDSMDGLLDELHYIHDQVEYADPIGASVESVREQSNENNAVLDDLDRRQAAISQAKQSVALVLENETPDNREECEDLRAKLQDLNALDTAIRQKNSIRSENLERALVIADKFQADQQDAVRALRDIQDNLLSQDSPGVDPATIEEQQRELQAIQDELARVRYPIDQTQKSANELSEVCGTPGKMEIQKHMEDLQSALEEIEEGITERTEELTTTLDKAGGFDLAMQSILSWLPPAEDKLQSMGPVSADPRNVRIQIEEMKVMKVQVHPRYVEIQSLNQHASELKNASPVTAESLTPQVKEVNDRWNNLLKGMYDRERDLKEALVTLGEIDHALDDILGFLQQVECDLQQLDYIYGDPKFIETHLKKLNLVQKDLRNQESTVKKLNKAVDEIAVKAGPSANNFKEKQAEMNELYKTMGVLAHDKQNELQDTLKEVKGFIGDVEDLLRWLNDFRQELKRPTPMGALPDTAQEQFDKFMDKFSQLHRKEEDVQALLLNGEDMLARCREQDGVQLREDLKKLRTRMYDTKGKAERRKVKLDEHLVNVRDFHAMLKIHTDWLNNAEKILGSFKYPSKLVDRVTQQMQEHKSFREDIDAHREIMQNLDRTGTYLKYFGRKQDTVYIKNLLISIKLRWKKLVRRADEKGRLLQQAYKEDKRFYEAWRSLCDWLSDSEKRLKKYASNTPGKVKQDIDELKRKHREEKEAFELFQHQLSAHHPQYYSTMRLGRSLKDRCTKSDAERDILNSMLEELKNRWNITRSIVAQRRPCYRQFLPYKKCSLHFKTKRPRN